MGNHGLFWYIIIVFILIYSLVTNTVFPSLKTLVTFFHTLTCLYRSLNACLSATQLTLVPLCAAGATGAARDLLRGVDVPRYSFAGGKATLSCSYDLSATRLYSLKWYHNGTEFYRYVPTEREQPINIQPSHKFTVNVSVPDCLLSRTG